MNLDKVLLETLTIMMEDGSLHRALYESGGLQPMVDAMLEVEKDDDAFAQWIRYNYKVDELYTEDYIGEAFQEQCDPHDWIEGDVMVEYVRENLTITDTFDQEEIDEFIIDTYYSEWKDAWEADAEAEYAPTDLFSEKVLNDWAIENGWVKEEE